jgi:hypothetical protein
MAIISSYPTVLPTADDLLIGTKVTNTGTVINPTKTFRAGEVVDAGLGYTSYVALVTQTGTNAPVDKYVQNNTGATFTWARTGSGTYTITASSNTFTADKTIVFYNLGEYAFSIGQPWTRTSDTVITISLGGDGRITNGSFEIRIYS